MSDHPPIHEFFGSAQPVELKLTLGEVAILWGVCAAIPVDVIDEGVAELDHVTQAHAQLDYSVALIKLSDAVKRATGRQRYAPFARQMAEIEQLRARLGREEAA